MGDQAPAVSREQLAAAAFAHRLWWEPETVTRGPSSGCSCGQWPPPSEPGDTSGWALHLFDVAAAAARPAPLDDDVRIRVLGGQDDARAVLATLGERYEVREVGGPYGNRRGAGGVRFYARARQRKESTE